MKKIHKILKELKQSISYLCYNVHIKGYSQQDLNQLLHLKVLEDWKKDKKFRNRKKGWWYLRLKWHLLNLIKKESRNPINRSVHINILNQEE